MREELKKEIMDISKFAIVYNKLKNHLEYSKELEENLNNYYIAIEKSEHLNINDKVNLLKDIKNINKLIIKTIKSYEDGNFINSYKYVDKLVTKYYIEDDFFMIYPSEIIPKQNDSFGQYNNLNEPSFRFFRARKSFSRINEHSEMFHIPNSLKYKVPKQRYSIDGSPALYLGTSSLVCWQELDRPPMHDFYISAVKLEDELKLFWLNLSYSYTFKLIEEYINDDKEEFIPKILKLIPLKIACSYKDMINSNKSFNIEYIIPQLVSTTLNNHGYDGIIYMSNKINADLDLSYMASDSHLIYSNVVIFTKDIKEEYCDYLKKYSEVSKPVNFSEYIQSNDYICEITQYSNILCDLGAITDYRTSNFFKLDQLWFLRYRRPDSYKEQFFKIK